eukprot:3853948-Pleurochrysis_carterae.AAC.1
MSNLRLALRLRPHRRVSPPPITLPSARDACPAARRRAAPKPAASRPRALLSHDDTTAGAW